jgi:hypothetical protein
MRDRVVAGDHEIKASAVLSKGSAHVAYRERNVLVPASSLAPCTLDCADR